MTRDRAKIPLLAVAALAVLALALLGSACGGGGGDSTANSQSGSEEQAAAVEGSYSGGEATPPKAAPELKLDNYLGEPVDLAEYKGKAVLVTFIYDHCPDVCPLIVSHLKTAQAELGDKAKDMQIVAVSTDPRGDTPKTVAKFLDEHAMTGKMQYLIGSRPELEKVWTHWNIVAKPAKANPDLVEHSALIYGIAANGKITTLYPANFAPSQIVHDVPLLEQQ
ncbi:MAG TPA: SCO family protein [Solirubrobacterales bacterium]|nr:SCO family protein [Solirubrobacterales bacterium]